MELGMEPEDAAAQKSIEQLRAPRADRESLRIRPGDVPESDDGRIGQLFANQPGQQGEVVVLHQDDGIGDLGLFDDGAGEFGVRFGVLFPVAGAKGRSDVGDVAKGP